MRISSATQHAVENLVRRNLERRSRRRPVTQQQVVEIVKAAIESCGANRRPARQGAPPSPGICQLIRGLSASSGLVISPASAERDVACLRAMTTGSSPGSYLVPVLTAEVLIQQLAQFSTARAAGCQIWPM